MSRLCREDVENEKQSLHARCNLARAEGTAFPTIWLDILRRHTLVASQPVQVAVGLGPLLEIPTILDSHSYFAVTKPP